MRPVLFVMTIVALSALPFAGVATCCAEESLAAAGPRAPYDPELYGLSYDVFLANSNPAEAFWVAEKAVAARPGDYDWRRRAAQSAEWSGKAARALEHWFFLAQKSRTRDAIDHAFRLARDLGDGHRLKQLLEQSGATNDPGLLREYVAVCERAGTPDDAIAALERQRGGADRNYVLEQLARLYEAVGRITDAVAARIDLASFVGVNGADLVKTASMIYSTGDIQSAYSILSLGIQLSATEQEYWKTYGDLAWALQDTRTAEKASRLLLESGAAREVDFQRLIMVSREQHPDQAYQLSLDAWRRFGRGDFLTSLLELGVARKRFAELAAIIDDAKNAGTLKTVEGDSGFWILVAQVEYGSGNPGASVRSYQHAVMLAPGDGTVAVGYVWWLLNLDQRAELRSTLQAWNGREKSMPGLSEPFGVAYAYLGENSRALVFFQSLYRNKRNDPSWLASYADILEQSGWSEAAFLERVRAMSLARKRMKTETGMSAEDQRMLQLDCARLEMLLVPGDGIDNLMKVISRAPQDEVSRQLVAAWALSSQRNDLARIWYWREFARMTQRPRWVELSLALEDNDRVRIARLLEYDLERLAYRDAVEGAQRAGWIALAETHAFERFQTNERDHLLDQQIRTLYGTRPGMFRYRVSLFDQGGIGFLEQQVSLSAPVSNRFSLRFDAENTNLRAQRSGVLASYPATVQSLQATAVMRHGQGTVELAAGMRDARSRYAKVSLLGDWKIDSRRTLSMSLLVGGTATESLPLQIAGLKDEAGLALVQALTPRDALTLKLSGRYLRDQVRRSLGEGASVESELTHRLLASWPDTAARFFGGYYYYAKTGVPIAETLALIPPGGAADASFYLPASFSQFGAGVSVGQEGRTSYIRDWRPFGAGDIIWNSTNGFGYRYELGLLGPVFGLDSLEVAFAQDSGSFGRSNSTTRIDVRYKYNFR